MSTIRDLLARKGPGVVSLSPSTSVRDAARVMNDHGIGGVLVLDEGRLVGIFTERDVMRRVVATGLDPAVTPVSEVMTGNVVTASADQAIAECRALMSSRRIRHVPVQDGATLVGVITSGDILAYEVALQEAQINELQRYVFDLR
jgi:CBS domain-containing protein